MRGLVHEALLYRDAGELVGAVRAFAEEGLQRGEQVLVALPGAKLAAVRTALGASASDVTLLDMEAAGRNPARLLPVIEELVARGGDAGSRFAGEPVWPGRSDAAAAEAIRHEALVNHAFADAPLTVLCPYDAIHLGDRLLTDAERTHPTVCCQGDRMPSPGFTDPLQVYASPGELAPPPPGAALHALEFDHDLGRLRRFVRAHAVAARLGGSRLSDLLIAANEAATNTLVHTGRPGVVRIWQDMAELVCEFIDDGRIDDPLAGRRLPSSASTGGRGLWLINQLCDLVQLRPGATGTVLRIHVALEPVATVGGERRGASGPAPA